jgi:DNA-3-methyladenine glycosylase
MRPHLTLKPPIEQGFYLRSTEAVARDLLGCFLVRDVDGRRMAARIVETEAYLGARDAACHSFRGQTKRNAAMFGPGGHAYVYFIYGFHHCLNVVTMREGEPEAVLIRALEPVEGVEVMKHNRKDRPNLCSGPGVLCQALQIDRAFNGHPFWMPPLQIHPGALSKGERIISTPRIGVDYAGEAAAWPLRFCIEGNAHVSGGKKFRVEI